MTFLSSLAAPISQFKVPPVIPVLMDEFNISLTSAGMLISVFAITGFILALPASLILQRLGIKISGLIATGFLVIGSMLGALSTSYGLMLISRVIEGVGMGLMAVIAPAAIAMWFPPQKRGTPMGIWATWVPLGAGLMFFIAPRMTTAFGWQAIWWFSVACSLLAFGLVLIFLRMPPHLEVNRQAVGKSMRQEIVSLKPALAKADIWLLGATFGLFALANVSINTYYSTFLSTIRNYSLNTASLITSLPMLGMLIFTPLAGIISDKIGSRKKLFTWPILAVAGLLFFPFQVTGLLIPLLMLLSGVIGGAVPTAIFSATPEIMRKPEWAGLGMGVLSLGQNLGTIVGPILFGNLAEGLGWTAAGIAVIPLLIAAFFIGRAVRVR